MKITVLGAAGNAGSRIVSEAITRGHEVTAVVRYSDDAKKVHSGVKTIIGDASNAADVARLSAGQDVVISAVRPASGQESNVISTTRYLMDGLADSGARLLIVGGAATLKVPGGKGKTVLEDSDYLPVAARYIGQASADQFGVCRDESRVDWVYLSPAAQFFPGTRTGEYRMGRDELLVDRKGRSRISMEDAAVVLLDEVENPKHHQTRITAAY
ncbi:MAG: NAD(P)H-binding protein [Pseudomonadota bacterium]